MIYGEPFIDELIAMTADEHGLQLGREFDALQPATEQPEGASAEHVAGPSDVSRVLAARLNALGSANL